ncbi:hypothetical protein D3869_04415 [Azospirillum brasilense]|uniref:Uncharacterized protein n=1 Tax=Azospirillum brasilense TaxID=192 RepID=A0A4D8R2Z0_AZOBR|nr:hypothetical protein D3869_04415 [Azospirillum brasilense]
MSPEPTERSPRARSGVSARRPVMRRPVMRRPVMRRPVMRRPMMRRLMTRCRPVGHPHLPEPRPPARHADGATGIPEAKEARRPRSPERRATASACALRGG